MSGNTMPHPSWGTRDGSHSPTAGGDKCGTAFVPRWYQHQAKGVSASSPCPTLQRRWQRSGGYSPAELPDARSRGIFMCPWGYYQL